MKNGATTKKIEKMAEPYIVEGAIRDLISEENAKKLSSEMTAAFDNVYCSILPDGQGKKLFSVYSTATRRIFYRAEIAE